MDREVELAGRVRDEPPECRPTRDFSWNRAILPRVNTKESRPPELEGIRQTGTVIAGAWERDSVNPVGPPRRRALRGNRTQETTMTAKALMNTKPNAVRVGLLIVLHS